MSYQPPQSPPPGGYDPNDAARGGGGYDPNATSPIGGAPGGYTPPPQGGAYDAPPPGGGYGAPPAGGGYGAPPPPAGGGYGGPPPGGGYGAAPPPGGYGAPPAPGGYGAPPPAGTSTMAIGSLVAGVLSLLACCSPVGAGWLNMILGIAAIVLYVMAQNQLRAGMGGRGLAVAGLVTGIIGLLLGLLLVILVIAAPGMLDLPMFRDAIATLTAMPQAPQP